MARCIHPNHIEENISSNIYYTLYLTSLNPIGYQHPLRDNKIVLLYSAHLGGSRELENGKYSPEKNILIFLFFLWKISK